jgi:ribonuclease J
MSTLRFIPVGGLGEIGCNASILAYSDEGLLIDFGLMFPRQEQFGVELIVPDVRKVLSQKLHLRALLLTHGHEDHIGAVPYLLERIKLPIYASRLTSAFLKARLRDFGLSPSRYDIKDVKPGHVVNVGPFNVEFVEVAHSIPGAFALSIDTPAGKVFYTGDFRIDSERSPNGHTDMGVLSKIGRQGVLLLLSESTNSERDGFSGSEKEVASTIEEIIAGAPGRVVVTTFSSNISRISLVIELARKYGRSICVSGRSMRESVEIARALGYLDTRMDHMVSVERANELPANKIIILASGTQGEPLSALSRLAFGSHKQLKLEERDRVIISANPVPGNEGLVRNIIDNFYRQKIDVYYSERNKVHVSGHAFRQELAEVIRTLQPRYFVPIHGEYRQLYHHAELARSLGVLDAKVVENGTLVEVDSFGLEARELFKPQFIYMQNRQEISEATIQERKLLSSNGVLSVALYIDEQTGRLLTGPSISFVGVGFNDRTKLKQELADEIEQALNVLDGKNSANKKAMEAYVTSFVHKKLRKIIGEDPIILTSITYNGDKY